MLLLAATATATDLQWTRTVGQPAPVRDAEAHAGGLVAVLGDGRVARWAEGWSVVAEPGAISEPDGIAVDDAGTWVWRSSPATLQRLTEAGWAGRESPPLAFMSSLDVDGAGLMWAAGLHGALAVLHGEAWTPLSAVPGNLVAVADPDGGAWVWSHVEGGIVVHVDADGTLRDRQASLKHASVVPHALAVTPKGLVWGGDQLVVHGTERLSERTWDIDATTDTVWAVTDAIWRVEDPPVRIPFPTTPRRVWRVGDDVVALDATGTLWRGVEGYGPTLRDVTASWGVGDLGTLAVPGDVDGDGDDDLLVKRDRWRLYLQEDGFVDQTDAWRLSLTDAHLQGACDVDGNGQIDPIGYQLDDGAAHWFVLRALRGRFVQEWLVRSPTTTGTAGNVACVDLSGDGAPELILTGAGRPALQRRVALLVNDGVGRFREEGLPVRGLSNLGFTNQVFVDDLDGDGHRDVLLTNYWGRGHTVLQGTADGQLVDRSRDSGLWGLYDTPGVAMLDDLDGDGLPDLVVDNRDAVRAYANTGNFTFADRTTDWQLGNAGGSSVLQPLDGRFGPELISCGADGCSLHVGTETGLRAASGLLPAGIEADARVVALDLGGDGDRDLLFLQPGDDVLVETLDGPVVRETGWRSNGLQRRVVRAQPRQFVLGAVTVVLWGAAVVACRRRGSRVLLGGPVGFGLVGAALAGQVALLEAPPLWQAGWTALGLLSLPLAALELRFDAARRALRVAGYRLRAKLGGGGMGTVYLASAPGSGDEVALKIVHPDLLQTEADRRAYRQEAEFGASIVDPRVVQILGWGEWTVLDDGRPRPTAYLVMERVRGISLREWLRDTGPVPVPLACAIVREVALGLVAVHAVDVVHRDVKPANVMLTTEGAVKLMDFGAARRVGQMTRVGRDVLGTLGYLAPEQGRGLPPDPRSDVYSCGVVLYELLTGRRPFAADDLVALLAEVLDNEPELPGTDADEVLRRSLAKDPDDRYASARALAAALEPLAGPITVSPSAAPTLPVDASLPSSHLSVLVAVISAYLSHWWRGGTPDVGSFAEHLMDTTGVTTNRTWTASGDDTE